MRYLVAVDGWEPSQRALSFAVEQAADCDAVLDVVHVVDEGGGDPDANEQIREMVEQAVGDADVDYRVHFLETSKRTKPADKVATRLISFAEDHDHDLVFLGNEATGRAERMIVGSVARTLIEDRSIPVTLVP